MRPTAGTAADTAGANNGTQQAGGSPNTGGLFGGVWEATGKPLIQSTDGGVFQPGVVPPETPIVFGGVRRSVRSCRPDDWEEVGPGEKRKVPFRGRSRSARRAPPKSSIRGTVLLVPGAT